MISLLRLRRGLDHGQSAIFLIGQEIPALLADANDAADLFTGFLIIQRQAVIPLANQPFTGARPPRYTQPGNSMRTQPIVTLFTLESNCGAKSRGPSLPDRHYLSHFFSAPYPTASRGVSLGSSTLAVMAQTYIIRRNIAKKNVFQRLC